MSLFSSSKPAAVSGCGGATGASATVVPQGRQFRDIQFRRALQDKRHDGFAIFIPQMSDEVRQLVKWGDLCAGITGMKSGCKSLTREK